ncbi:MAG: hypothetical protein K2M94_03965 [Paramuribaculum sp.]|nr:hypothetical protein [Paramuribaculum sp.]
MKPPYEINDRVSFMARCKCVVGHSVAKGLNKHFVGYIKQIRRSVFGYRYVISVAKSDDIFIVKPSNIFGKLEKKTNNPNNNE